MKPAGKVGKTVTRELTKSALQIGDTVFGTFVDFTLWLIVYIGSMSVPQSASGQMWRANREADEFLQSFNYESIKNALTNAKRAGLVRKSRTHSIPRITEQGLRRLRSLMPFYDSKRMWDGRVYLITYDIPEKSRTKRNLLRESLIRIGCGKLQESVWITPYDPTDLISGFVSDNSIPGTVIVSSVGKDGSVGDEDLKALVVRVYGLEKLNTRYKEWMSSAYLSESESMLRYLAVLRDDPQLPFDLMPDWWLGDEAYFRIKSAMEKLYFQVRPHFY
ncbi:hypothetical protein A2Z33_00625 [Candidatus Gottesmanbacteria bacterium RBG_16_52_11]|uniref:Uncharacterized protein n=1 Tax=Candidatus Gottesmanbacteria bacterium RBG_16_52_11 TaxID=1798374 RepID=A0A1F5YN04_9BACT|nr:MAG: hypothetical protein A2Z33_00625 [Candidatus Gottesmanbacteria bacterium RBG_16_52_11]